jgi:hypothetical protein
MTAEQASSSNAAQFELQSAVAGLDVVLRPSYDTYKQP